MMKIRSLFLYSSALVLAICLVFGLPFGLFVMRPVLPQQPTIISIQPGQSFTHIAETLEREGVVSSAFNFRILATLKGASRQVQAGDFNFAAATRPGQVLDRLVSGDTLRLQVTLPEGLTITQIAERLAEAGYTDCQEFQRLATDREFTQSLGVDAPTLEGYLFPETYRFGAKLPSRHLLRFMVDQFNKHLVQKWLDSANKLGLDLHQLVTLASIIQKETARTSEMPIIAAVFHNRLKRNMRLQADPTVIYGIENFNGNLTRHDLHTHTPYNTYTQRGLPAGPIANPGAKALRAAANPADVPYLYFVSKGNGSHKFSRTLREHNAAVRRYQLRHVAQVEKKQNEQSRDTAAPESDTAD
jgi:UPF0755 protein